MRSSRSLALPRTIRKGHRSHTISPRARKARLALCGGLALLWTGVVIWRLASLQIVERQRWQEWAVRQHLAEVKLATERGPIYDRRGRLMAVSVPASSLYVRPGQVREPDRVVKELSTLLQVPPATISEKLKRQSPFVWIERQLPRALTQRALELDLKGVGIVAESRRYYPFNHAASALIGKVGTDGTGLSGLEQQFERLLHAPELQATVRRDALGNLIQVGHGDSRSPELPKGSSLTLTIDAALQQILDQELEQGRRAANAKATMGVLMDAHTGEILAMGQSPAANFNVAKVTGKDQLRNLVVETIYEPGSTIKPLVAAAALDAKLTHPKEMLDCGNGFMTIGKSRIKDVHPHKELSVFDVVVRSSNIGMSRLGMRLGREQLRETLARFGFGSAGGLPLPGITGGILRASDGWARVDEATHSFGHGFAVTPLQVVRAISSIANGGVMPEPRLFLTQEPSVGQRVISDAVARQVREMMYAVVEDPQGTGRRAAIDRVRVGGKTGTAERVKEGGRGYEAGAYISSFVGFADGAPLGAPRTLSLIIVVDRPNTTSIYGGTLAAPVFKQVMERSLRTLATTATLDPAAHLTRPDIRPVALVHPNIIQRDSI